MGVVGVAEKVKVVNNQSQALAEKKATDQAAAQQPGPAAAGGDELQSPDWKGWVALKPQEFLPRRDSLRLMHN